MIKKEEKIIPKKFPPEIERILKLLEKIEKEEKREEILKIEYLDKNVGLR